MRRGRGKPPVATHGWNAFPRSCMWDTLPAIFGGRDIKSVWKAIFRIEQHLEESSILKLLIHNLDLVFGLAELCTNVFGG
jgi:hypothetical protein